MFISDVLRTKGYNVVRIHPTDSIELAVRKLAEHRIGALVVEDRWMKPIGVFSERDFINAVARNGAAVLGFQVQQLMSTPILTCRFSDRVDAVLATMTTARIRHLPVIEGNELKQNRARCADCARRAADVSARAASLLSDRAAAAHRESLPPAESQSLAGLYLRGLRTRPSAHVSGLRSPARSAESRLASALVVENRG